VKGACTSQSRALDFPITGADKPRKALRGANKIGTASVELARLEDKIGAARAAHVRLLERVVSKESGGTWWGKDGWRRRVRRDIDFSRMKWKKRETGRKDSRVHLRYAELVTARWTREVRAVEGAQGHADIDHGTYPYVILRATSAVRRRRACPDENQARCSEFLKVYNRGGATVSDREADLDAKEVRERGGKRIWRVTGGRGRAVAGFAGLALRE